MQIPFPFRGIDKGRAAHQQAPGTSADMKNMRLYDTLDNRARGGQRPALDKWGNGNQIGGVDVPIVAICVVSTVA
ncbi:hypothetical protein LCGC14_2024340 [marine sediment metagenome]|uniref:Uncharacterized protein n=1 Tax=marine sediment metagenome TaxID=412755 RepID=A0A0F9FJ29_9ZZZZ